MSKVEKAELGSATTEAERSALEETAIVVTSSWFPSCANCKHVEHWRRKPDTCVLGMKKAMQCDKTREFFEPKGGD